MSLRLASALLLIVLPQFLFAQFTGGNSDGVSNAIVSQSSCLAYTTDFMFSGGSGDGFSSGTITQGACLPATTDFMFSGGSSDGFSSGTITQGVCLPVTTDFIFSGGSSDGFSSGTITQGVCLPVTTDFMFFGGSSDGFNSATLTQGVCLPITTDFMFYGGSSDGFSNGTIAQGACLPATTDFIFYGGVANGFSLGILQQSICPNNTPLPIELLEFKALLDKEGVEISWTTASEINNDFFTVERSNDGVKFTSLATVKGAGNSTQTLKYHVTDGFPYDGANYYRLKQTDFDGIFSYSNIILVYFGQSSSSTVAIYPNPNDGKSFYVKLAGSGERLISLEIQDVTGRKILSESIYLESNIFEFVPSVPLTSGVYLISILEGQKISNQKLVVK